MPSAHVPIPAQLRADLFAQLANMEKAGIAPDKAFALLRLPEALQPRVAAASSRLRRGLPISTSGQQAGLFSELEAALIEAACSAGSPGRIYARLAERHRQRAARTAKIKSRLMLPCFMLCAALFIQPIPALLTGSLTVWGYLWSATRPLMVVAGLAWLGVLMPRSLLGIVWGAVPLLGPLRERAGLRDFFDSLALALDAGLPMLDALPKACAVVEPGKLRGALSEIAPAVRRGSSFSQALSCLTVLEGNAVLGFVHTGEESGTLPEMLSRFSAMEDAALDGIHKMIADWVPRVVYACVAAWMAYGLLSGAGATRLPPLS